MGRSPRRATSKLSLSTLALAALVGQAAGCTGKGSEAPAWRLAVEPGIVEPADAKPKEGEEKPKWDVMAPPGHEGEDYKTVVIDVDEGTWLSVDVSPDGREVVFDLLGDIYVMPIGGGEARALTEGIAWDMQPRFSPDGKYIAFTSDRGGGDNIWVMKRDGSDVRQITKETFRLVNGPVWSPDGQFIAVRKHFTKRRSLGAGEVWLYHVSGGKGMQMTEKPNDQKDVNEPAFSADGRYVYYSHDATPGPVFEYNKDPHAGIYVISRLDRQTGLIDRVTGGPGGAVRPTPSPDGRSLAFVRRLGTRSVLTIRDLASGLERPIYDGLDRDMQEAWAIHGVYPTIAWTPDNAGLVLWAGGKIWRVDAKSGAAAAIPFHVKTTRRVAKALRKPIDVDPDEVDLKMLRWVTVSPDGRSVVYQALGHLWIRALPDGQPRRLTKDDDVVELMPAFSRDGKSIVYATWNDASYGALRVIPTRGGKAKTITPTPGHYVEPSFSPDGKTVVYRKIRGGWSRSPAWSEEPGIYAIPAKGGEPLLVSREGVTPHFGATNERVFYVARAGDKDKEKVVLRSLEVDGSDLYTHASSENATEFRVSPDGRWIAWNEGFHAFVAPLPATGRTVELGPKAENQPIARVTRDAGDFIHWSSDSARLYWSLGPELFSRELNQSFAFLEGAPEKPLDPPIKGLPIGMKVAADRPSGKIAIVGARLVTMAGEQVIEDGTIVVDRHRIAAVGPRAQVAVPGDAKVIDGAGLTVIPGLVDVHAHGSQGEDGIIPQRNWLHDATLAFGVTTIHDPSNDTETIFAASELARAGLIDAPRIFSTGTILYGAKAPFTAEIDSLDDALRHLRRMQAVGAFSVKSYNQPRREQRQQVIEAARQLGMMVVPEGGSLFQHNMTMVVDGHTGVEHAIPVARAYRDVDQLWGQSDVGYTPTLGVAYGGLSGENYWYAHTEVWKNQRLRTFAPRWAIDGRARRRVMAADNDWNHINAARFAKQLIDAGGKVQIGAHGQREGLAAHWEIWMLVQGGMTPHEALRAATLHGAAYLGLDRDIGSIEVGKLADLAIIDGNPLQDIRTSERVRYTVKGGRIYDAATMDEIGNRPRKRPAAFWEATSVTPSGVVPEHAVCHGHP
ncbi:MAG: PD40 domain-containing protein [Myxococcales bacterium]|nr:PD40 domain-containing protein [Myxococcales bacterium]